MFCQRVGHPEQDGYSFVAVLALRCLWNFRFLKIVALKEFHALICTVFRIESFLAVLLFLLIFVSLYCYNLCIELGNYMM